MFCRTLPKIDNLSSWYDSSNQDRFIAVAEKVPNKQLLEKCSEIDKKVDLLVNINRKSADSLGPNAGNVPSDIIQLRSHNEFLQKRLNALESELKVAHERERDLQSNINLLCERQSNSDEMLKFYKKQFDGFHGSSPFWNNQSRGPK